MDLVVLKKQIQTKELNNFYIFTGPEIEVQKIYIEQMAKVTDSKITRLFDISELLSRLDMSKSLLRMRQIFVLRECKEFLSSEKLQARFEHFRASDSIIILVYDSIDKRTKAYNKFKDDIVQFDYLSEDILVKYIQKEIPLSDRNARGLVRICDRDYGRILLEIDKIRQYVNYLGPAPMFDGAFQKLLDSGVIYQSPQDRIFDFVDTVLRGKITSAYRLLEESYEYGENTLALLSVLYTNAKQLLQCQSYDGNDIENATGLTSWQIKCAKNRFNNYSNGELVYLLRLIQKCEQGIKSGTIEENIVMDYLLVNLWS